MGRRPNTPASYVSDEWITNGRHGMLIGYIGADPYAVRNQANAPGMFEIGTATVLASGVGTLWLGFNDDRASNNTYDNYGTVTVNVPDPASTLLLFGTGLAGIIAVRRRGRR